ncbi:hypothetical protein TRFO_02614 [Tritrichomonas foetus]|uniref:UBA domain-containing protein n=1 Tax=Tritrichomonas foetus TaxID=1144522 RepID=A0A1J4L6I0_9EUKA|nr:hypothetical protein TRFO_02614 [Tritrichomonas foetus]|eukprot:OHT17549.1 hypothetical protein TRFO_02614 [Tritrichomonas foetus]
MWLIFKAQKKKYVIEFSGEETFADIEHIFREVYHITQKFSFSIDGLNPIFDKTTPLNEFPGTAGQQYVEILLSIQENSSTTEQKALGPISQTKYVAIGRAAVSSSKAGMPARTSSTGMPSRTSSTTGMPSRTSSINRPPPSSNVTKPTASPQNPNDPPNFNESVQTLVDMGFPAQQVQNALRESKYDIEQATEKLLSMPKTGAGTANFNKLAEDQKATAKAEYAKFTTAEKQAINRLKNTGVDDSTIIATYVQCNKDEAQTRAILSQ